MVVGMGEDPSIGEYERLMLSLKTTARKELVLLHPDRMVVPGSTREWLKVRPSAPAVRDQGLTACTHVTASSVGASAHPRRAPCK